MSNQKLRTTDSFEVEGSMEKKKMSRNNAGTAFAELQRKMCRKDCGYRRLNEKLSEECGVIGITGVDEDQLSTLLYFGLISLQHRGQEAAGIAVLDEKIDHYKDVGLVQEIFTERRLKKLRGRIGVGHVRYSTAGDSLLQNAQPLVVRAMGGMLALAHNGNLINAMEIRTSLQENGAVFQTTIDTEVIASLIARNMSKGVVESISDALRQCKGSFSLAIIIDGKLVAARDPYGMRPLSLGKFEGGGYIVASETCAFDVCGATYVRDILPGEILVIDGDRLESHRYETADFSAMCSFEYVYFAMPESSIEGKNVFLTRKNAGKMLYRENPTDADMVMAVPDSGIAAAIGYAEESGIPFDLGMIKNKYLGRTFIQPSQELRELAVHLKLNVLKENIAGKRVIMIDDSIVRGTTMKKLSGMLRKAGAKEVHVRICSPPVTHPCYFGIDTPSRENLVGANYTVEEIRQMIGADSLTFLSAEGLFEAIGLDRRHLCSGCFGGTYPMEVPENMDKFILEKC